MQCDKFYVCETDGTLVPKLCEVKKTYFACRNLGGSEKSSIQDGLVYDIPGKSCNHPQRFCFMFNYHCYLVTANGSTSIPLCCRF